jgi:hypothetical protein
MKLHARKVRRTAGAFAVTAAAAGLVLTGCGKSTGSGSAAAGATSGTATPGSAASGSAASGSAASGSTASATTSASQASTVVSTGSVPFPTTVGDTWDYSNSNGTTTQNKIASSTQVATGQEVAMAVTLKNSGTTTRDTWDYIVEPNGQIALPTSQFTSSFANSGATIKIVSGGIFWPSAAQLASGQPVHTTLVMSIKVSGTTEKITEHVTSQGQGTQTVTVPAGTYKASVINVTETADIMGYNTTIDDKSWMATGVGPVQSEVINVDGSKTSIDDKEELTSFVKG